MATEAPPTVGDNVAAEMKRHKVSQAAVAAHLGLSQAAVSARVRGKTEWRASELTAVATLLGVPVTALLGEVAA